MKKIAIPVVDNNQLQHHFRQCNYYEIYTISNAIDTIKNTSKIYIFVHINIKIWVL